MRTAIFVGSILICQAITNYQFMAGDFSMIVFIMLTTIFIVWDLVVDMCK